MTAAGENLQASGRSAGAGRRSAARLAAVQALYQVEIAGAGPEEVIGQFLSGERPQPDRDDDDGVTLPPPDAELFTALVEGVIANRAGLDSRIAATLSPDWTVPRLEILVRLILEAGVFELTGLPGIPPKVTINEYVNVAKAFFEGAEPGLINGVLDAVARSAAETPDSGGAA
ncbi:MAG: transcription antitermination factor NusB [Alphaproteobacteria bacterium]|nr:transcription antitermination factor NusB [Alphaproteobacteria bacterium]